MKKNKDIAKTLVKLTNEVIDNAIDDVEIRLPQLNKNVWLGNYNIKLKLGGKKKHVK